MKKIVYSFVALSLFLFPSSMQAAEFQAANQIQLNEALNEDVYVAGSQIHLEAALQGDFFGAGERVILKAPVSEDVFVAGSLISIDAPIQDDVRVVGETILINASVQGDIIAAGQNLTLAKETTLEGEMIFFANNASLDGTINGNVRGTGQNIYVNGTINGDLRLHQPGDFHFGPNAKVTGNLIYTNPAEKKIPEGVVGGQVMFEKKEWNQGETKAGFGFSLYGFLATLFFGLFLIGFLRHGMVHNVSRIEENIFRNLGIGFLMLISLPIAAILLMITVIGIPMGLLTFVLWIILLFLSNVFGAMVIGDKIVKVDHLSSFLRAYASFTLGTLVLMLITLIPVFGPIFRFLVMLVAMGGFFMAQKDRFEELRKKKLI